MTSPPVRKKVVLVGPTHPYSGGVAQHTTRLALELEKRLVDVTVESWKAQYPRWLRPGRQRIESTEPEIGLPSRICEMLSWYNPISWWLSGQRSQRADFLVLSIPTPLHTVVYLVLLAGLRRRCTVIGIVHNVLPHEPGFFDRWLMSALLTRLDRIIVHGSSQAELAESLGAPLARLHTTPLPSPWPAQTAPLTAREIGYPPLALFFGAIRPYKGLDLLIDAVGDVPDITLLIAGEFWCDETNFHRQIAASQLESRVTILPGYVERDSLERIFCQADFLVLPYRSGTASVVKDLAFRYGLPVIGSQVGAIADRIEDDVNGALVEAGNVKSLQNALRKAANPSTLARWTAGVASMPNQDSSLWERYCYAILD